VVVTRWVERLFDDRFALLRLGLLALSGLGYLVLRAHPDDPLTTIDWAFGLAAIGLCPVGVRWPLASAFIQSFNFGLAICFGDAGQMVPEVGATWAVFELVLRASPRKVAMGAAALAVAHLIDAADEIPTGLLTWLYGIAITVGVPMLIGMNIRSSRQLARQAERRVAVEARAARAGERSAIARELHDLVAHHVASMVLRVGVARHVLAGSDPRVTEVFDDLHSSGTAALTDLRQLVGVLRDPAAVRDGSAYVPIDPGALPAALATTVDRAAKTGLTVDATIDPAVATLDAVRGLAILRLTQEGLTNVAKHAGPGARARVSVRMVDGAVHWEITDDGGGVRPAPTTPGHGLTGMRERVEVLGGELIAGPKAPTGAGWRLHTVLPAEVRA
jgi:signal transduction histidine kinase